MMIKCSDIYTEELVFGNDNQTIIHAIGSIIDSGDYDWLNSDLSAFFTTNKETTEYEYLLNRQDKYISPLFERIYNHYKDNEDAMLTISNKLASIIFNKFMKGWSKLADAVFSDYNPIENYNMKENRATLLEEVTNTENEETVKNKYSGFNTDEMKDVSESATEGSIDTTKTTTGGKTNNELTRSGNIGVTTSQQMIESSFNLAKKKILDLIYRDIDTILFIDYYN